jgi:Tfp pilus assembly protein PilX
MIEFAFVRDHTRGASLFIVTCMLVIFALSVPTTIAFTTARFADD